jgi:pheromone alpha factor receptor
MANNTNNTSSPFNPTTQTISILLADGVTEVPVSLGDLDSLYLSMFSTIVNYGSQIGACFIMLVVLLTMTPKNKFARIPTLINTVALAVNMVRCLMLALFFTSNWCRFYPLISGDISIITSRDYNISISATALTLPSMMLLESSLAVQAWAMIQLWPTIWKWSGVVLSIGIALVTVGLKFTTVILQCQYILYGTDLSEAVWLRRVDFSFTTVSICWFCFLFIVRLGIHMWTNRSILPTVSGISAMEVLVMTNGILMLIPGKLLGIMSGEVLRLTTI